MSFKQHSQETWNAIKTEYLTGNYKLREIGAKYGVDHTAICRKAKKENWQELRNKIQSDADALILTTVLDTKVSNNERAIRMTDKLLAKIEQSVEVVNPRDVSAMKNIVTSLKDLREMEVFRITNQDSADIRVEMGGTEDYAD